MTHPNNNNNEEKCKICPECKNTLHESAFSWYGEVCNGCGEFLKNKPRDSDLEKPQPPTETGWEADKMFKNYLAVAFAEFEKQLPRTRVMAELGTEPLFYAFKAMLMEFLPFIRKEILVSEREKLVEKVKGISTGQKLNNLV